MAQTCAIENCPHEPVVRLSYATRPSHTYLLCEDHRGDACAWVRSRFGDIDITEEKPDIADVQPCLFDSEEAQP